jgi:hypothetical protein
LTVQAVEPSGAGYPVVVKQRTYTLKVISSRVAILGKPKPNADGSQDPPGLYWQSLNSDARQLLVRTTGDHYAVHINPEQTKILFLAKVVHADRTDTRAGAYVINVDGTGLKNIMPQSASWQKWWTCSFMKAGYIATSASLDGTNSTSGVYLCKDDGSEFQLLHQLDNVGWVVSSPQGEDAYVYGTHNWVYNEGEEPIRLTTFWLADDVKIWSPIQGVPINKPNGTSTFAVPRYIYDPIILEVNENTVHWIALSEPVTQWPDIVTYGRRAFWEYKLDTSTKPETYEIEILCETSDVRNSQPSPRFCVSRDGRYIGLMDMQSQSLGMTNPDVLYIFSRTANTATATEAAKNWSTIETFAVANLS